MSEGSVGVRVKATREEHRRRTTGVASYFDTVTRDPQCLRRCDTPAASPKVVLARERPRSVSVTSTKHNSSSKVGAIKEGTPTLKCYQVASSPDNVRLLQGRRIEKTEKLERPVMLLAG